MKCSTIKQYSMKKGRNLRAKNTQNPQFAHNLLIFDRPPTQKANQIRKKLIFFGLVKEVTVYVEASDVGLGFYNPTSSI